MSHAVRSYDLIVFDWDGTLSDSCGQIVSAVQDAAASLGLPRVEDGVIRAGIGMSFNAQLAHLYRNAVAPETFRSAFEKSYYHGGQHAEPPLFEGVKAMLQWGQSRQKLQAIATGKSRQGLNQSLLHHELGAFFNHTICAGEAISKPDPDMLMQLLSRFDCPADRAVMVGDTLNDAHAAQHAGVDFIGMTTGGQALAETLQTAPHVVLLPTVLALLDWFQHSEV